MLNVIRINLHLLLQEDTENLQIMGQGLFALKK